jgi:hypothetical protein
MAAVILIKSESRTRTFALSGATQVLKVVEHYAMKAYGEVEV